MRISDWSSDVCSSDLKPVAAKAAKDHPIRDQIAATRDTIKSEASKKAASLKQDATTLKNQASTKARDAATKGKDKAAEAVGSLAKLLEDSAGTVARKFGKQYGDYARSAASTVAGLEYGRESCRARACKYEYVSGVAVP